MSVKISAPTSFPSRGSIEEKISNGISNGKIRITGPLRRPAQRKFSDNEVLIAVMGASGVGKSTFINLVGDPRLPLGERLEPFTHNIQISQPFVLDGYPVSLIDTPGFDDDTRSDIDIFHSITNFLYTVYKSGRKLSGIIYLHRISDVRTDGVAGRYLTMVQKLCGIDALTNVVVATTGWSEVDVKAGQLLEEELKVKPAFKPLFDAGTQLFRYDHDLGSAHAILRSLSAKTPKTLLIQAEMVDKKKIVLDTAAGLELQSEIRKRVELQREEMRALQVKIEVAKYDEVARKEMQNKIEVLKGNIMYVQAEAQKLFPDKELPEALKLQISIGLSLPPATTSITNDTSIDAHSSSSSTTTIDTVDRQPSSPLLPPKLQIPLGPSFPFGTSTTDETAVDTRPPSTILVTRPSLDIHATSELASGLKQLALKYEEEIRELRAEMVRYRDEEAKRRLEEDRKKTESERQQWEKYERRLEEELEVVRSTFQAKITVQLEEQRVSLSEKFQVEIRTFEETLQTERKARGVLEAKLEEEEKAYATLRKRFDEEVEQRKSFEAKFQELRIARELHWETMRKHERLESEKGDLEWKQKYSEQTRVLQTLQVRLDEEVTRRTRLETQIEEMRLQRESQEVERKKSDTLTISRHEERFESEKKTRIALEARFEEETKVHIAIKTKLEEELQQVNRIREKADIEWQQKLVEERRTYQEVQTILKEERERRSTLEIQIERERADRKLQEDERSRGEALRVKLEAEKLTREREARRIVEETLEKERQVRAELETKFKEEEQAYALIKIRLDEELEQAKRGREKTDVEWQETLDDERRAREKIQGSFEEELVWRRKLEVEIEEERTQRKLQEDESQKSLALKVTADLKLEQERRARARVEETLEEERQARLKLEATFLDESNAHTVTKRTLEEQKTTLVTVQKRTTVELEQLRAKSERELQSVRKSLTAELEQLRIGSERDLQAEKKRCTVLQDEKVTADLKLEQEKTARARVEETLVEERQTRVKLEASFLAESNAHTVTKRTLEEQKTTLVAVRKSTSVELEQLRVKSERELQSVRESLAVELEQEKTARTRVEETLVEERQARVKLEATFLEESNAHTVTKRVLEEEKTTLAAVQKRMVVELEQLRAESERGLQSMRESLAAELEQLRIGSERDLQAEKERCSILQEDLDCEKRRRAELEAKEQRIRALFESLRLTIGDSEQNTVVCQSSSKEVRESHIRFTFAVGQAVEFKEVASPVYVTSPVMEIVEVSGRSELERHTVL